MSKSIHMNMTAMDKSISQFRGLAKVCDTYSDSYKVVDKEGSGQSIDAAHSDDNAFHNLAKQMKALFSGTADFFERAKNPISRATTRPLGSFVDEPRSTKRTPRRQSKTERT